MNCGFVRLSLSESDPDNASHELPSSIARVTIEALARDSMLAMDVRLLLSERARATSTVATSLDVHR